MSGLPSPSRRRQTPSHSPPLPPVPNNEAAISDSLRRLSRSGASKTALPESSPISPRKGLNGSTVSSPSRQLRRSSSSLSGPDPRSATPTLKKKSSISSLQGGGSAVSSPRQSVSRRSSSNNFASSPSAMPFRPTPPSTLDAAASPPAITPQTVARTHFEAEIREHGHEGGHSKSGKTVIVLHDSCYGHRYSRPRTSKASLNTIVERPERIHASILGIATAYVRLGARHSGGPYGPHPKRHPKDLPSFPFRIHKSSRAVPLSSPIVTSVHGAQWMEELRLMCSMAEAKLALNGKELTRPEQEGGLGKDEEKPRLHEGDLYLCADSLNALEGCIGAVCDGVDRVFQSSALQNGPSRAFVCIRPPGHHCASSYPSGFCWLNNVHIGIAHASAAHGLTHAAIIDFDLHHGDGSQAIAWAHNAKVARLHKNAASSKKTAIGYFSLHDINSYPCEMGDEEKIKNASLCMENAHGQTIWNVHLQPWKHEGEFWELYETRYSVLLEKTRTFLRSHTQRFLSTPNQPQPKAAIFLSSGFDASEWEGAGMQRHKVNVPTDFYARLTSDVVRLAEEEGLGAGGRIISVLEGGYSDRALSSGVLSHVSGLAGTDPLTVDRDDTEQHRLGGEMGRRLGTLDGEKHDPSERAEVPVAYDSKWWALRRLEELEAVVNPPPPPPAPKKPRTVAPPTYSTPTQSFNAKIVASPKIRQTSSSPGLQSSPRSPFSRAPTPPPPEVDWMTAAHELSQLLVPSDRQTRSHKAEDLSVETNRVKKERRTSVGPLADGETLDGKRMQLRDRKARLPTNVLEEEPSEGDPTANANRRRTVASGSIITDKGIVQPSNGNGNGNVPLRPRRRSSAASSLSSVMGDATPLPAPKTSSNSSTVRPGSSGTSGTSRPASSMSVKSTNTAVPRKPRATAPKAESAKPRVLKKSSVPLPLPLNSMTLTSTLSVPPVSSTSGPAIVNTFDADLDSLSSGIKKMQIKLKVPSKEEHDAREKKMVEKKSTAKAPRKPAAPRAPKAAGSRKTSPKAIEMAAAPQPKIENESDITPNHISTVPQLPSEVSTLAHPQQPPPNPPPQHPSTFSDTFPTVVAPINNPPASAPAPEPEMTTTSREFIPYTAHDLPAPPPPSSMQQQEPLTWLPPNTSTPPAQAQAQASKTRADLPSFTSNSPIPFGNKANGKMPFSSFSSSSTAAAAVASPPPPPPRFQPSPSSLQGQQVESGARLELGEAHGRQGDEERRAEMQGLATKTDDIWDIPVTPKQ
jgi:histone deacetylase HOS3